MNNNIAKSLWGMLNDDTRKRRISKLWILLVVVFILNCVSNNWDSPLALLPRTATAIVIGYIMLLISTAYKFNDIIPYLNIEKIKNDAQQGIAPEPASPAR